MLTDGVGKRFQHIIQHLIQHQCQAADAVVTMDADMDTSLRDRLVRTLIPNNVERRGQTASTSINSRDNKRNVEWLLKQSLKACKLIQHRFNFDSTQLKGGNKRF